MNIQWIFGVIHGCIKQLLPLTRHYSDHTWLSIGDGRYGLDSYRLQKLFGIHVFPTDISENMLKKGQELGLFETYGVENAEHLNFQDEQFDIVFCKKSFHYCPRPNIALYEMLRVCKIAVILFARQLTKRLLNKILPTKKYSIKPLLWNIPDTFFKESGNDV